ncbi:hypothetical protein TNIN_10861 [Trichonephila inaurata madagascariensis]|uniref:Uncharacterized protein n=1 Tax=Trichonephila inaurata madagascariensis TaxID=2747483 RepID=A0A8X7C785_9ARAC|nr:hypothetical protein TNIN_10861 [Trichonephila inaurata madagascariensis]
MGVAAFPISKRFIYLVWHNSTELQHSPLITDYSAHFRSCPTRCSNKWMQASNSDNSPPHQIIPCDEFMDGDAVDLIVLDSGWECFLWTIR